MPVDPHTWNGDYLTATLLNGDFYRYNGEDFTPSGINFHMRRPLYKSFYNIGGIPQNVGPGAWGQPFQTTGGQATGTTVADTAFTWGQWMDPLQTGDMLLGLPGGGGTPNADGGLVLMCAHTLWPAGTAYYATGIGQDGSSSPYIGGTYSQANPNHHVCTYCLDIVDGNAFRWAQFGFNGLSSGVAPVATPNADGSSNCSRNQAMWASVYPSDGVTVPSLPAPLASWTGQTFTSGLLNGANGFRNPLRFLNMPPLLRAESGSNPFLTGGVANTLGLYARLNDTYSAWSGTTYTVPFSGLYLVHCKATVSTFTGNVRAGAAINGTNYWGPYAPVPLVGNCSSTKTQIYSLNAGDTIQGVVWPDGNTTLESAHMVVMWLTGQGAPSPLPSLPDTTYRYTAGAQGPLDTLFNAQIANNLNFLFHKPYLLSYQASPQTGIIMNTPTALDMDTIKGIVHADAGDNYSGWSAVNGYYVAPRTGWYMAVWEGFLTTPSLTTSPSVAAAISVNPSGQSVWDEYEQRNMITSGSQWPGASGFAFYFLRFGDTIQPGIYTIDSASSNIATATTGTNINSHFELCYVGL